MKKSYKTLTIILIFVLLIIAIIFILLKLTSSSDEDITEIDNTTTDWLETTIDDNEGNTFVRIEADVIGQDTDAFPVVTLRRDDFTTDSIKVYADAFFDNSNYHNQPFIDEYTVDEIDEIIDRCNRYKNELIENRPASMYDSEFDSVIDIINSDIDSYTTVRHSAPTETELRCDTEYLPYLSDFQQYLMYYTDTNMTELYGDDFDSSYMSCDLLGKYNNLPYRLSFGKDCISQATTLSISLDDKDALVWGDYANYQVSYDSFTGQITDNSTSSKVNNTCTYSEEDAILLCNNMINKLNISDMSVIAVIDLQTTAYISPYANTHISSFGNCGYSIIYGKTVNDKSMNYDFNRTGSPMLIYLDTDGDGIEELQPGYETLSFIVMDCGILSMDYDYPTAIDSISSESTPLLSFDAIMSIFKSEMNANYGNINAYKIKNNNIVITKIQLGLTRVTVDGGNGEYTLIPVWDFYTSDYMILLTINAIDGSIIDNNTGYIKE